MFFSPNLVRLTLSLAAFAPCPLLAQSAASAAVAASAPASSPELALFAVEIKTGAAWDASKPPNEQAFFRDHSVNLKKLRDQGILVFGARYADKGLVVLQVASAEEAHALMQQDASVRARVFVIEVHPFNVFYGGAVQPRRRETRAN